jgi:hypothetical protein
MATDPRLKQLIDDIKGKGWAIDPRLPDLPAGKRYILVRCPWHADSDSSLSIRRDGKWTCHGCGKRGDILDFLGFLTFGDSYSQEGYQLAQVIDLLAAQQITPMDDQERERWASQYQEDEDDDQEGESAAEVRVRLRQEASDWAASIHPRHIRMLEAWGISWDVASRFNVGWNGRRISFPAQYRGVTFGIKLRAPDGVRAKFKWIQSPGSRGGIYGANLLNQMPRSVVATEDEKSTLALLSRGMPAIGTSGGAGFWRSAASAWWSGLLLPIPTLVFWRDADECKVPVWRPERAYYRGDDVQLPGSGGCYFLKCQQDGISSIVAPTPDRDAILVEDGSTTWKLAPNPGLQCAVDFRKRFPRAVIVDSSPWKDAGDACLAGIDPREVIYQRGGVRGF